MTTINNFCYDLNHIPGILDSNVKGKLVNGVKGSDYHFLEGGPELGSWTCEEDVIKLLKGKSKANRSKYRKKSKK